jgi:hypothetical protein
MMWPFRRIFVIGRQGIRAESRELMAGMDRGSEVGVDLGREVT